MTIAKTDTCLLQVFNRYLQPGGEEKSVDRILRHLSSRYRMERWRLSSRKPRKKIISSNPSAAWRVRPKTNDYHKPVLAAADGGLTETVISGSAGFLQEPRQALAIARNVVRSEKMATTKRLQLDRNGREWLLDNTGIDDWLANFDIILQAAIDNSPAVASVEDPA